MGENNDTGRDKSKLEYLGKKVIHYQHHSHFLEVCLNLQTIPKGLQIKNAPCMRTTDNIFMKTWKNTLKNTEMALMHQLKEKDKAIYSELHKKFFTHITKPLDNFLEISDTRDLVQFFVEEENKLFNRRITKFVKVSEQHKLQDLRNHILITEPSSSELHSIYSSYAEKLQHVTSRKKRSIKQREKIVEDQEESLDHEMLQVRK